VGDVLPNQTIRKPVAAIVWGGGLAGLIDLTYATTFYALRGVPRVRVLQSIASGLLGPGAYQGGSRTAVLGVVLHFVIALGAACVFSLASRQLSFLLEKPFLWGPVFGAGIYAFMHTVVLPLAANPRLHHTTVSFPTVSDFLVHVLLLGPIIVFAARRFSRSHAIFSR
jgi:hypothetical protein